MTRPAEIGTALVAAGILAALGLLVWVTPAPAQTAPACHTASEVTDFYNGDDSVAYKYDGADAVAVVKALTLAVGSPPPAGAVLVMVGIDLQDGTLDFFLYGADGCGIVHLGPVDEEWAASLLMAAGVDVPFGSTYHQLPGLRA